MGGRDGPGIVALGEQLHEGLSACLLHALILQGVMARATSQGPLQILLGDGGGGRVRPGC